MICPYVVLPIGVYLSLKSYLFLSHSRIVLRMYLLHAQGFLLAGRGAHCNCWSLSRQTHTLEPWKLLRNQHCLIHGAEFWLCAQGTLWDVALSKTSDLLLFYLFRPPR